jgi:uncharacterized Ntn-hydrolase superfamily protein
MKDVNVCSPIRDCPFRGFHQPKPEDEPSRRVSSFAGPGAGGVLIGTVVRASRLGSAILGGMKPLAGLLFATLALQAADVNTFSIVGYDPINGDWGVAVASRYFSVGAVVPWAEAGVGAIATQANVNVGYGPRGLELLRQGLPAKDVLARLQAEDTFPDKEGRQVAIIDGKGNIATYTGPNAPKWAGDRQGKTWSAQGNILVGPQVPEAMGRAFEATDGELAEKLFAALKAGDDAGGDSRGKQSASMIVVRKGGGRNINNDRYLYLNVDDNPQPIPELRRLLNMNLGYLYQEKAGRLSNAGKAREAREAAAQSAHYMPTAQAFLNLGITDYTLGDKPAALADLRNAIQLDATFRQRFEAAGAGGGGRLRAILDDKEFLKQLLQ